MIINLAIGLITMGACLLLQSILFAISIRYYSEHSYLLEKGAFGSSLIVINAVMVIMVIGNLCQIAIWAALFGFLGEFDNFSEAFYHSAVNFATLGYGDFVMSDKYKLLGPLEAVNGVLMIGISSALLISIFQQAVKYKHQTLA